MATFTADATTVTASSFYIPAPPEVPKKQGKPLPIYKGTSVKLRKTVEKPVHGWGGISYDSVGVVVELREQDYVHVDFPECPYWEGKVYELRRTRQPRRSNVSPIVAFLAKYPCDLPAFSFRDVNLDTVCKQWSLPLDINLAKLASKFYLLEKLHFEYPNSYQVSALLKETTDYLADIFSKYLTMAIGGETRYLKGQIRANRRIVPTSLLTDDVIKLLKVLPNGKGASRKGYWYTWKGVVDKYGQIFMLEACYTLHKESNVFDGSIGGEKWATACSVLLDFLKGNINARVFVDTAWNLQHNGTVIFNKVWDTNKLKYILDANFKGNMDYLVDHAPPKIQALWDSKEALKGGGKVDIQF